MAPQFLRPAVRRSAQRRSRIARSSSRDRQA